MWRCVWFRSRFFRKRYPGLPAALRLRRACENGRCEKPLWTHASRSAAIDASRRAGHFIPGLRNDLSSRSPAIAFRAAPSTRYAAAKKKTRVAHRFEASFARNRVPSSSEYAFHRGEKKDAGCARKRSLCRQASITSAPAARLRRPVFRRRAATRAAWHCVLPGAPPCCCGAGRCTAQLRLGLSLHHRAHACTEFHRHT